eukprot:jgi/Mesvir1/23867/Mv10663-RA.1
MADLPQDIVEALTWHSTIHTAAENFDKYASKVVGDRKYMTRSDLIYSLLPIVVDPFESCEPAPGHAAEVAHPHKRPSLLDIIDMDGDNLISLREYMALEILISVPIKDLELCFQVLDLDGNGTIDIKELSQIMSVIEHYGYLVHASVMKDKAPLHFGKEDWLAGTALAAHLFGPENTTPLTIEKFCNFVASLHRAVKEEEFRLYDVRGSGTISARQFAWSLIASADHDHLDKYLGRILTLTEYSERIWFDEFVAFANLRLGLRTLMMALTAYQNVTGSVLKKDFKRAAKLVLGADAPEISDVMVDIVFHLFDVDGDEHLSLKELKMALESNPLNKFSNSLRDGSVVDTRGYNKLTRCHRSCVEMMNL